MNRRIRNWCGAGLLLGLGALGGWMWRGVPSRATAPVTNRASEQQAAARATTALEASAATPALAGRTGRAVAASSTATKKSESVAAVAQGETLDFTADLAKLSRVATLRLVAGERRDFHGREAWHLQAFAHTQNPLRMVMVLDDQFDSYSEVANLTSLQYELHLNERGQKQDAVLRMSSGSEPAPADATAARVVPGTRDPLGMLYYLRTVDWAKMPEVRSPVFDGHKLYEVRAHRAGTGEQVKTPAGEFQATKIELQVFDDGVEMKEAHFFLYLANAPGHKPVLLEAVLPIGTARVELSPQP